MITMQSTNINNGRNRLDSDDFWNRMMARDYPGEKYAINNFNYFTNILLQSWKSNEISIQNVLF